MRLSEEPSHSLHVHSETLSSVSRSLIRSSPSIQLLECLERFGFTTASELILIRPDHLRLRTGLNQSSINLIYDTLSEFVSPKPIRVSELIRQKRSRRSTISLGSSELDRLFGLPKDILDNQDLSDDYNYEGDRGIPTGVLTELSGESGMGKTCLSIQVSLTVQLPFECGGLRGGCIYLSTEGSFPTNRMFQIASSISKRFESYKSCNDPGPTNGSQRNDDDDDDDDDEGLFGVEELMKNVHLLHVHDSVTLIHTINYTIPGFLKNLNDRHSSERSPGATSLRGRFLPIRLIVLDSIAAIFRSNTVPDSSPYLKNKEPLRDNKSGQKGFSAGVSKKRMTDRASELNQVSDGLKYLANRFSLAVLVVNQVSDTIIRPEEAFEERRRDYLKEQEQRGESVETRRIGVPEGTVGCSKDSVNYSGEAEVKKPVNRFNSSSTEDRKMHDDDQIATKDSSENRKRLRPSIEDDDSRSVREQIENPSKSRRRSESGGNLSPLMYNRQACHFTGRSITNPSKEASLGIVWSNCINQRVMLIRTDRKVEKDYDKVAENSGVETKSKRNVFRVNQARIVFSPFYKTLKHHPKHHHSIDQGFMGVEGAVDYFIDSDGIVGLS